MLAIFGGADTIVPVEESIAGFRAAFEVSGNEALTVRVFEGGDHGLRVPGEGGMPRRVSGYFEFMGEWVASQAFGSD